MSGSTTIRLISAYQQMAQATLFLSGFFRTPAENFYNSEEVEIDIVRSDEAVSIVIQDLSAGYRMNTEDIYTNKGFKPPVHKEAVPINSFDLLKRMPGQNPFENPDFRANLILRIFGAMQKIERKIRRSIELQASQILTTGKLTLIDSAGVELYAIDFKPKATHFPTAGTAWNAAGSTKINDLRALGDVIRSDGLSNPDQIIMGDASFEAFISDEAVQKRLDVRNYALGTVAPMQVNGQGGAYRGRLEVGNYFYDLWTYGGRYAHPQTGVSTLYVPGDKVIMRSSSGRMDATFGAIPNIGALLGANGGQLLPELPGRVMNAAGGMDLFTNAWLSQDGEQLFAGIGARPLLIPSAIDTFGCLDTGL